MFNLIKVKDVIHDVVVKFIRSHLPEAENPYFLKAVHQKELTIHDLAQMATAYNLGISPRVIEEGFNVGLEFMAMCLAEGCIIKSELFTAKLCFSGGYDGSETHLADGVFPEVRFLATEKLKKYIRENTKVIFDGKLDTEGSISEVIDEATGNIDETASMGRLMTVHGDGLKVMAEEAKRDETGVFYVPDEGQEVKVIDIAINEPRTLRIVVPSNLISGVRYKIVIRTQGSAKGCHLLKDIREIRSDITVIPQ